MRHRGATCRSLLLPSFTTLLTLGLCSTAPLLTAGCGGNSGAMPASGGQASNNVVSDEARDAVRRIMAGVGRSVALHTPAAGTSSQSYLSYEGGYEAMVHVSADGAVTGRISGPASGLPADYRLDGDHADVTYQDGSGERISLV